MKERQGLCWRKKKKRKYSENNQKKPRTNQTHGGAITLTSSSTPTHQLVVLLQIFCVCVNISNITMDLNKLVTHVQGLSDSEGDLKSLKTLLTKNEESLVKNINLLEDALNTLDPNRHSLGWLFLLYVLTSDARQYHKLIFFFFLVSSVRATAQRLDPQRFISHTQIFLQNVNPQHIRLAPSRCIYLIIQSQSH